MSIVLTVGTFDLFHAGHVKFLWHCAKIAGKEWDNNFIENRSVVVGLNTDEFVARYKGKKPLYSYDERYRLLLNSKSVYDVVKNDQASGSMLPLIEKTKAQILVIGSDWATKDYYAQIGVTQQQLEKQGVLLCYIPYTEGISTTQLKERILSD